MHVFKKMIYLNETDATGALYFAEKLKFASQAFEDYLSMRGQTLNEIIINAEFLMPVVHAQVDFKAPACVGDQLRIELSVGSIGDTSFTLVTSLFNTFTKALVGSTKVVQVTVSKSHNRPIPIPELVLAHLRAL